MLQCLRMQKAGWTEAPTDVLCVLQCGSICQVFSPWAYTELLCPQIPAASYLFEHPLLIKDKRARSDTSYSLEACSQKYWELGK